jgi:two-component sensor histidine kinase
MNIQNSPPRTTSFPRVIFEPPQRTVANYERELTEHRNTELELREALARDEVLIRQKDEIIQQQKVLSQDADHRLANGLQMIASLLSLQSRTAANAEAASQLAGAANRVAMIDRVNRRLHSLDSVQTVAFKRYLKDFCRDFSAVLSSDDQPGRTIAVEGIETDLPTATALPLGLIVNELITNAAKYGDGGIAVKLEPNPQKGYALSVSNDGSSLPEGFNPATGEGLGMKLVQAFVKRIGGELRFGRGDNDRMVRFTVLFS